MFGGVTGEFLNENSLFDQKAMFVKVFAHEITKVYRQSYGIHAVNGILFNHESPMENFVEKITRAVGRIKQGIRQNDFSNLDSSKLGLCR